MSGNLGAVLLLAGTAAAVAGIAGYAMGGGFSKKGGETSGAAGQSYTEITMYNPKFGKGGWEDVADVNKMYADNQKTYRKIANR
jgi:hypothetical protein